MNYIFTPELTSQRKLDNYVLGLHSDLKVIPECESMPEMRNPLVRADIKGY